MISSNKTERHRHAYWALPWVVICLTILVLLLRPLLGRIPAGPSQAKQDKDRCDEKGIQKAKDDYAKAMKARADADLAGDEAHSFVVADYNEATAAFNEVWGVGKQLGGNELTMHAAAHLGVKAAEEIAPILTIAELVEFTGKALDTINKDITLDGRIVALAQGEESDLRKAQYALEAARSALRTQRMLEAECEALKKRKSSPPTSSDDSGESKLVAIVRRVSENTRTGGIRVLPPSKVQQTLSSQFITFSVSLSELLGIDSNPAPQSYEDSDLVKMANREGGKAVLYADVAGRARNADMWLGMAGEAFSHVREQLPYGAETNQQKLTGSKLSECTKWLKVAFEDISKGVDSFDGIKSDLDKASQEK